MKKRYIACMIALVSLIFLAMPPVSAHCPLCTAATGAAVAVTRFYGVDDLIVGLFIGAFVVSTALWFNNWLLMTHGKHYLPAQNLVLILVSLAVTIITFNFAGILNQNEIFGVDKLVAGTLIGSIMMPFGFSFSKLLKKWNNNRVLFPFQSIIISLLFIILTAVALYFSILK